MITSDALEGIEYKYIIANWDNPQKNNTEWEVGYHNRKIDLGKPKSTIICGNYVTYVDDKWNMDKITLNLLTQKGKKYIE